MQKNMVCTDHDILKFRRQEETHTSMAHHGNNANNKCYWFPINDESRQIT